MMLAHWSFSELTSTFDTWSSPAPSLLTDAAALAAVALIGYLFGRRTRQIAEIAAKDVQLQNELARATGIARELHDVALRVRQELAAHQAEITAFQKRLTRLQSEEPDAGWRELSQEAENLLGPTLKLATNLSVAYDQLRKQSAQLMTFAGSRVDADTGVHNRRAMQEQLDVIFAMRDEGQGRSSVALFSFSTEDGRPDSHALERFAKLLKVCARGTDVVARYSSDEFAVIMPQTTLSGALVFSQRLLGQAEQELGRHVWGGVVEVGEDDTPQRLLSRADSALYSARTCGETCLFQHTGTMLRRHSLGAPQLAAHPAPPSPAPEGAEVSAEAIRPNSDHQSPAAG